MLFTPGLIVAAGATIVLVAVEKTLEDFGVHWVGTALKLALPLIGMAVGVYFLETNPILWWILK